MTAFRRVVLVLTVVQTVIAAFLALVGAFADGGTIWERLLIVVLHPLAALSLLFLVSSPRVAAPVTVAVAFLLSATVVADIALSWIIAQGTLKGDWELPLVLAVLPLIGLIYAVILLRRQLRATAT